MYLSFYNLTVKPFQISTDPKFLWLGEKHKEALAILKYGIMDNRGFLLLSGDVGTGKTTLINELVNSLGSETIVATVPDPCLETLDFYNFIAYAFKINKRFNSKGDFIVHFTEFLQNAYDRGKKVLMIIDEAQRLSHGLLEEIRLLSNMEKPNTKLINIFFVGQNEFNDSLLDRKNRALRQRITINYNIDPLSEDETKTYIHHRLKVAGSKKNIFTPDAIRKITFFSMGNPRLVNICCDHALLTGYVRGRKKIDGHIIKECVADLRIKKQPEITIKTDQNIILPQKKKSESKTTLYTMFILLLTVISGALIYLSIRVNGIKQTEYARITSVHRRPVQYKSLKEQKTFKTSSSRKLKISSNLKKENHSPVRQDVFNPEKKDNKKIIYFAKTDNPVLPQGKTFSVYFGYNSNEMEKDTYPLLDRIAKVMIQNPEVSMVVKGYTDRSGSYLYNKKLSEFRANIVKSYFVGKGVNPERIKTLGMGPAEKRKGEKLESGSNRRVEIEIKSTQP